MDLESYEVVLMGQQNLYKNNNYNIYKNQTLKSEEREMNNSYRRIAYKVFCRKSKVVTILDLLRFLIST